MHGLVVNCVLRDSLSRYVLLPSDISVFVEPTRDLVSLKGESDVEDVCNDLSEAM